jgi:uncharacterized membrane protein YfcA
MSAWFLTFAFGLIAALFASVGQAGGAGYVGIMGWGGYGPAEIKATALALTVLVSAIGIVAFVRAGLVRVRDWYPFALLGVPGALLGGWLALPGYRPIVAALLLVAAARMVFSARLAEAQDKDAHDAPPLLPATLAGGAVGFVAGITGAGGGIFLVPLLLTFHWAPTRRAAAIAQVNNLYTALAALIGVWAAGPQFPQAMPQWALAAAIGGLLGAWAGSKHLPATVLRYLLAAILLVSGIKLALG